MHNGKFYGSVVKTATCKLCGAQCEVSGTKVAEVMAEVKDWAVRHATVQHHNRGASLVDGKIEYHEGGDTGESFAQQYHDLVTKNWLENL